MDHIYLTDKYTYGTPHVYSWNEGAKAIVGKFCSIADNVKIYLGGNHNTNWVTTFPFGHIYKDVFNNYDGKNHPITKGNVNIGNDVWIAQNVVIMSGITIGDGAIIANNSHVVKNVEPYTIVGGNPAKFIKYRFTPLQISKLLEIKWWDWDDSLINNNIEFLCNSDIDYFINNFALQNNKITK